MNLIEGLILGEVVSMLITIAVGAYIRDTGGYKSQTWARAKLMQWTSFLGPLWLLVFLTWSIRFAYADVMDAVEHSELSFSRDKGADNSEGSLSLTNKSGGELSVKP